MDTHKCANCGEDTKLRTYTGPVGHRVVIASRRFRAHEVCLDCFIWAHIPKGYTRREKYVRGNATRRPSLGVPWLDQPVPRLGGSMLLIGTVRPRL